MPDELFEVVPFGYGNQRLQYLDAPNNVLGYLEFCAAPEDYVIRIHALVVTPENRKKGIATKLLNHFIGLVSHDHEKKEIEVDITPLNPWDASTSIDGLINLYTKCGFKVETDGEDTCGKYMF